jgi:hypothetical protein
MIFKDFSIKPFWREVQEKCCEIECFSQFEIAGFSSTQILIIEFFMAELSKFFC